MDQERETPAATGEGNAGAIGYAGTVGADGRQGSPRSIASQPACIGSFAAARIDLRVNELRRAETRIVDIPEAYGYRADDDGAHWSGAFRCGDQAAALIKLHPKKSEQSIRDWIAREMIDAARAVLFAEKDDPADGWVDRVFAELVAQHESTKANN
jgi:hypothetical protein